MADPVVDPASTPTPQPDPTPAPAPEPTPALASASESATDGDWPADWRQKYSTDPKILKRLERYASPKAALDALFAAQAKISSGGLKSALKPDATPEELAAWREENGIPATPADYEIELGDGMVFGEADKPVLDEFLAVAHEANLHPSQVNKALNWFMRRRESELTEQEARDRENQFRAIEELRAEYGPEYKVNIKLALEVIPENIRDVFLGGRLADGTKIGDNPDVIRWLSGMARELNPIASVVPGSGMNADKAMEAEINSIKAMMGDRNSEYWKGPKAAQLQARYRELLAAQARIR